MNNSYNEQLFVWGGGKFYYKIVFLEDLKKSSFELSLFVNQEVMTK